jgi:hypothetical protein
VSLNVSLLVEEEQLDRLGDPPAVPVMLPLRPIPVGMRDPQPLHQGMSLPVVIPEVAVTQKDQPLITPQVFRLPLQQLCDPILLKVLLAPEDVARAVPAGAVNHQRGVPGSRPAEDLGMPQEQAEGPPP